MKRGGGSRGVAHGQGQQQQQKYRNACLTMHQPWASLLIHGIKRIEGRSWPSPIRGRLWIHAAAKVPDPETISAMEEFYKEIYAVDGVTDLKFPEHYPVSRLLGCVNVVGCIKCEELVSWEEMPEGVRLEGQTEFCWLCEQPQKLVVPFEMRGFQGIYNLEKKVYEGAVRGLSQVRSPFPVRFCLPDPSDSFSLKPGSLVSRVCCTQASTISPTPNLTAAIAGARAAATQFSRKQENRFKDEPKTNPVTGESKHDLCGASTSNVDNATTMEQEKYPQARGTRLRADLSNYADQTGSNAGKGQDLARRFDPHSGDSSYKIFAAALRGLKSS